MVKKYRYRMAIFATFISFMNATGSDDKDMLLLLTSPHLSLTLWYYDIPELITVIPSFQDAPYLWYLINIVGWFLIGWLIEIAIESIYRNSQNENPK